MLINCEQSIIDYLNKYGFLFENDTLILLDEIRSNTKIEKIKKIFRKKKIDIKKNHEEKIDNLKNYAKDVGEDLGKDTLDEFTKKIRDKSKRLRSVYLARLAMLGREEAKRIENVRSMSKKGAVLVSGLSLAAMIIHLSYQLYREEKNKIIKSCSGKEGRTKELCIRESKIKAIQKRIAFLNSSTLKCRYSKDPLKCKDKIDEEILELREYLRNEGSKFGKKLRIEF